MPVEPVTHLCVLFSDGVEVKGQELSRAAPRRVCAERVERGTRGAAAGEHCGGSSSSELALHS